MSQIFSGERRPGLDVLAHLEELTGVPARSWADADEEQTEKTRENDWEEVESLQPVNRRRQKLT